MAVTIRLSRHGRKNVPFYRIVATDKAMKRDGRYLELVGTLDPISEPPKVSLKEDRIRYWVGVGANPSDTVSQLIEKQIPGFLSDITKKRNEKIKKTRAKRKATIKASGKSAAPKKAATKKAAAPAKKAAAKKA